MWVLTAILIVLVLYLTVETKRIKHNNQFIAEDLGKQLEELKRKTRGPQREAVSYEWYEDGWPFAPDEVWTPFENPVPFLNPDDYTEQLLLTRYRAAVGHEKSEFLRRLRRTGVWLLPASLAEELCRDGDASVRVWFASHGELKVTGKNEVERDFEAVLEADSEAVVRAALFSNPHYSRLSVPWARPGSPPAEGWQQFISARQQIERLAIMRNPHLPSTFVVALMKADPLSLGMTRDEQASMIVAAARNPDLIDGSRGTGRKWWGVVGGEADPPFEEYGEMWRLTCDRWLDTDVPFEVFRYIQTTPKVKLEVYNRCEGKGRNEAFREIILGNCEPREDYEILKLGWNDPGEECRRTAKRRVGSYPNWVVNGESNEK
jgi:hypothetical protein